jgi:hypothetical protein
MARGPRRNEQGAGGDVPHAQEFRAWLRRRGTSGRVINDTLSRTKRASTFIPLQGPADDDSIRSALQQNRSYTALSTFVRSQLKRSTLLYRTFLQSKRDSAR